MGLSSSSFTQQELEEYAEVTYFTKGEIIELYKKFVGLVDEGQDGKKTRVSKEKMMEWSEIRHNPFAERLCEVFSTDEDGSISFDDFVDMMNALSDRASSELKSQYAFRVFDLDEDNFIGKEDLQGIVKMITKSDELLDEQMMDELIGSILDEADLDEDGQLSISEFEHVMSKSPDFANSFKIRL